MRWRRSVRLGSLRWPNAAGVFSSCTQVPWAVRPCSFSRTTWPRIPMSGYRALSMSLWWLDTRRWLTLANRQSS